MEYAKLRMLAQMRIERSDRTEGLYRKEEEALRAVKAAATDLGRVMSMGTESELKAEDVLALELAMILQQFGGAGARAARLIVERYGEDDPEDQEKVEGGGPRPFAPKPDSISTLEYVSGLDSHSVYKVEAVFEKLKNCGFTVEKVVKVKGLKVNGMRIRPVVPEWGEPGFSAIQVLEVAFHALTGEAPHSVCTGRGFRFDDILKQLRKRLEASGT